MSKQHRHLSRVLVPALALGLLALAPDPALAGRSGVASSKQARANDVASEYVLERDGDLFRIVKGRKCQVTNDVLDFKVSQHPRDLAVIYFVRREGPRANLYVLHNTARRGDCPKAKKLQILADLDRKRGKYRYSIVSSTKTEAVSMALSRRGVLKVWSRDDTLLEKRRMKDYRLHDKYGKRGAPFSRYVGFALDRRGRVLKIDGRRPQTSSYDRSQRYRRLDEFFRTHLARN